MTRGPGIECRLELVEERRTVAAEDADEAETALLERAAGEEGVPRPSQSFGARLVPPLEGPQGLLVQPLELVQGPAAGRLGRAAERRIDGAHGLLDAAPGRPSMASRADAKAASTSGLLSRAQRREDGLEVVGEVGDGEGLGLEGPGLRRPRRG